jgi:hypothetical protein
MLHLKSVQHGENDPAGHGDVKPDGESHAGDRAVSAELSAKRPAEGNQDEWTEDDGEDGVRNQNGEVHESDPTLTSVELGPEQEVAKHVHDQE